MNSELSRTLVNCRQLRVTRGDLITSFPIHAPDGVTSAPSYSFASNLECGVTRRADDLVFVADAEIGVALNTGRIAVNPGETAIDGVGVLYLGNARTVPVGPLGTPGGLLYVDGDALYFHDVLGNRVNLSEPASGTVSGPLTSMTNELARYANADGDLITTSGVVYTNSQVLVADGSLTKPAYHFTSATATGLLRTPEYLGVVKNSVLCMTLDDNVTLRVPLAVPDGSVGEPSVSFTDDETTGLRFENASMACSVGGVDGFRVSADSNIVFGNGTTTYGGARGVLKLSTVHTIPTGIPNVGRGGILYADTRLRWLNAAGVSVTVGGDIPGAGTVLDGQVLVWNDTTATSITARSQINDAGAVLATAYGFTGDADTGLIMMQPTKMRLQGNGVPYLDVSISSCDVAQQLLLTYPMRFTLLPTTRIDSTEQSAIMMYVDDVKVCEFDADQNLTLMHASTIDYGGGHGVVGLPAATIVPTSGALNGGFVYIKDDQLCWRNKANAEFILTVPNIVSSDGDSTPSRVARFHEDSGTAIQSSAVSITTDGQVQTTGVLGYRFAESVNSGLVSTSPGTVSIHNDGIPGITFTPASMVVHADHVFHGVNGTLLAPSFSFTSNASSGLYLANDDTAALVVNGSTAVTVASHHNVGFGTDVPDFAGGRGTVYFSELTTAPSGILASGGLLYVAQRTLYFYNAAGVVSTLTGIEKPTAANNAVAFFDDNLGCQLGAAATLTINDSGQILVPTGTLTAPGYTVADTIGMSLSAGSLYVGVGASAVRLQASAMTATIPLTADSGVRVGGSAGATISYTQPTVIQSIPGTSAGFAWKQNGTPIMNTVSTNTLNLSNAAEFTGGINKFEFGKFTGTNFSVNVSHSQDVFKMQSNNSTIATFGYRQATFTELEAKGNARAYYFFTVLDPPYAFVNGPTTGLGTGSSNGVRLFANGVTGMCARAGTQMALLSDANIGSGTRTVAWGPVVTAPQLPTTGVYMYQVQGQFMRVANAYADVALNGAYARAKWSTSFIVANSTDTLITTSTNDTDITNVMTIASGTISGSVNTGGWWEVMATATWDSASAGFRRVRILINDVEVAAAVQNAVTTSSVPTAQQVAACVPVSAAAIMTVRVYQSSGAPLNVNIVASAVLLG